MTVLVLAALVLVALLLGVHLFGQLAMNPAMRAVDFATYVRMKRAFDVTAPRLAKPLMLSCLVVTAIALIAAVWVDVRIVVACAVALLALIVTLLAILRGDLPINRAMANWSPDAPPEEWRSVRTRWERFFLLRAVANAVALVALAVAAIIVATALG